MEFILLPEHMKTYITHMHTQKNENKVSTHCINSLSHTQAHKETQTGSF